jgi:hypothetical protein
MIWDGTGISGGIYRFLGDLIHKEFGKLLTNSAHHVGFSVRFAVAEDCIFSSSCSGFICVPVSGATASCLCTIPKLQL